LVQEGNLKQAEYEKFIHPIEKGMLVELQTMEEYKTVLASNRLQIMQSQVLNKNCAKTWDFAWTSSKKIVLGARRKNGPCVCGSSQGLPGHESRLRLRQFITASSSPKNSKRAESIG